jgi:hypothetical protein
VKNPHPTSDFQVIDIATSGLGLKSRLHVDYPGAWLVFGVGRAFVPDPSKHPLSIVSTCGETNDSPLIWQLD